MTTATVRLVMTVLATTLVLAGGGREAAARPGDCLTPDQSKDLKLALDCEAPKGVKLWYQHIHILKGGVLRFADGGDTHIWARAIIVEDGGVLKAGTREKPFGTEGGKLTIHLWGAPQPGGSPGGTGVACASAPSDTCGTNSDLWYSNITQDTHPIDKSGARKVDQLPASATAGYKGPKDDYFYGYHPLAHDEGNVKAYFGYKVLAVSAGGTLELFGKKGACTGSKCEDPSYTGRSWVRLKGTAAAGATTLTVETPEGGLGWEAGDQIVVTTTDYLPGHSELLQITGAPTDNGNGTTTITLDKPLAYTHHGERFPLDNTTYPGIGKVGLDKTSAETRGAVGLLSRSIRIVSAGKKKASVQNESEWPIADFPAENSPECASGADPHTNECYFGGHTVFRQGFASVQVQGVEFYQLGQGGRVGHYPIHYHHARKTQDAQRSLPPTYVKDSSIWDSMTRWIVLHGTQDVTLARNVGYKSIGHGYYLEDGTEINNSLLGNLGVLARGGVQAVSVKVTAFNPAPEQPTYAKTVGIQRDNPRAVPGILAAPDIPDGPTKAVPFRTDVDNPTVFWIMNGWNDFKHNLAAGANMCGTCYWLVPGWNSGLSAPLPWESYASMQSSLARAGSTPLKSFVGNACTSAQFAFNTITDTDLCHGVGDPGDNTPYFKPIPNPLAGNSGSSYFPNAQGFRKATLGDVDAAGNKLSFCNGSDCSGDTQPRICGDKENLAACTVTTLDNFTSSFTAAPYNFAALWMRNQWYLLSNSVITDAQNAGVNFVTGGGYTTSDRLPGLFQLVYKSVFIGQTQPDAHAFARDGGPFNPASGLLCEYKQGPGKDLNQRDGPPLLNANYCANLQEGVTFQLSNFAVGQHLLSFYDGPAVQDSTAYVSVHTRELDDCKPDVGQQRCRATPVWTDPNGVAHGESHWMVGSVRGLPKGYRDPRNPDESQAYCYLPNAAIGWKQPNGFYYPPAFRSRNLFFGKDVGIRHFVFEPLFTEGTLTTDRDAVAKAYCGWAPDMFNNFSSNDRQTVLLDEDGTLTGFTSSYQADPPTALDKTTTVVNLDAFLAAPVEAIECLSDRTSRVTPYQYVTTVVYPAETAPARNSWSKPCTDPSCYGIPIYRQDVLPKFDTEGGTKPFTAKSLRMMGQDTYQRSSITVNHGTYYLDTANNAQNSNVFQPDGTYYLFTIYARAKTRQIYQIYVGKSATFNPQSTTDLWLDQAALGENPIKFKGPIRAFAADEVVYDKGSGILTVTLDHAKLSPTFTASFAANCGPKTYCHVNGAGQCVDASGSDAVCRWGPVDLDCPDGGCYAIGLKLPADFVADGGDHRPATTVEANCLTKAPPWSLSLVRKPNADGTDACPDAAEPQVDDFCNSSPTDISIVDAGSEPDPDRR